MVVELVSPQLTRRPCVKRRRLEMSVEMKDTLSKLQVLADRLSSSMVDLSRDVQPLVELLQTQTSMIEALATQRIPKQHSRGYLGTTDCHRREHTYNNDHHQCQVTKNTIRATHGLSPIISPIFTESPSSHSSTPTTDNSTPISSTSESATAIAFPNECKLQVPRIRTPVPSQRLQPQITEIIQTPPTPPRSPPPPPYFPSKNDEFSLPLRSKGSFLSNSNGSTTSLVSSTHTNASCSTCDSQPWHLMDRPDPRDSDMTCESHVQEATTSLITAMKEKKRTAIGPLDGGTFNLYSADYRRHYCVHDRSDRQSLLVYSESRTWDEDFPGVPAPVAGEVAMELIVYPDCLLIVKPFKVPKYAGWKWHSLDAIGDNAKPTTIEVMFLGNGFIKVRVRLSELLGEDGMEGEPDRFIEFAGIWSPSAKKDDQVSLIDDYESPLEAQLEALAEMYAHETHYEEMVEV